MPTGLRFAKVESETLPKDLGAKHPVSQQLSIWGDDSYKKEGYIEYIGKSEFGEYNKYKISFYEAQKINGYYKEDKLDSILVEVEKFFYVSPDNKFILIRASKGDSYKIIKLLKKSDLIKFEEIHLDLKEFKERISIDKSLIKSIVGAWITNLENVNISTVAIFGSEVDQSDEFDEYASQEESKITSLIIDFGEETIAITYTYGAVFYNRRNEINLLQGYEIIKNLLQNCDMFIK